MSAVPHSALVPARTGQVAIVTGGTSGLGEAIARSLAEAGTTVVVTSRSAERASAAAARLAEETGSTVHGVRCDVTAEDDVDGLEGWVRSRLGRLDVLVTCAGAQARGSISDLDLAALRACLDAWDDGGYDAARAAFAPWLPLVNYEAQPKIGLSLRKHVLARRGVIADPGVRPPSPVAPQEMLELMDDHLAAASTLTAG